MADAKISSFNLSCPVPRVADDRIVLAHGGGGRLTHQLIEKIFMPAFANDALEQRHDGAVVLVNDARLAFTTDSFVVRPLIFPGGNIGDLAVNGTVNDLAIWRPPSLPKRRIHSRRRPGDGYAAHGRDLDAASGSEGQREAGDRRYEGRRQGQGRRNLRKHFGHWYDRRIPRVSQNRRDPGHPRLDQVQFSRGMP
jgi:hypothetical protein